MDDVQSAGLRQVDPADLGVDPRKLANAVAFAESAETRWPRNLTGGLARLEKATERPLRRLAIDQRVAEEILVPKSLPRDHAAAARCPSLSRCGQSRAWA